MLRIPHVDVRDVDLSSYTLLPDTRIVYCDDSFFNRALATKTLQVRNLKR